MKNQKRTIFENEKKKGQVYRISFHDNQAKKSSICVLISPTIEASLDH